MKTSQKTLDYLNTVVNNGLIEGMRRYKIIEDLARLGISININNADLTLEDLRNIYLLVAEQILYKHRMEDGTLAAKFYRGIPKVGK